MSFEWATYTSNGSRSFWNALPKLELGNEWKGRQILAENRFRIFEWQENDTGAFAGPMNDGSGDFVLIGDIYLNHVENYFTVESIDGNMTYNINLQFVIAHEIDHTLGYGHINGDPWLTENSLKCSGIN